jgi:hypothetical protein
MGSASPVLDLDRADEAATGPAGRDWTDGEQAVLTGVVRSADWQQHQEGDEALRRELGLADNGWSQPTP